MSVEMATHSARNIRAENTTIAITAVRPSGLNPRRHFDEGGLQELADSIREHGILEPIVARYNDGWHEIICGERRWRAAQIAGLTEVPVRVLDDVDDRKALELALVENLVRRDIDPIEEAEGYRQLQEMGYKVGQIAEKVNRSQEAVSNAMRLLKLPEEVREHISSGKLSPSHGKALAGFVEYPRMLEYKIKQALDGATTKAVEQAGYDWNAQCAGAMARVCTSEIGVEAAKECTKCKARRKTEHYDGWLCLNTECLDAKKQAHKATREIELRAEHQIAAGEPILRTADMNYSAYVDMASQGIPATCSKDCEHRKMALGYSDRMVPVCLKPGCHRTKKSMKTRDENKLRRAGVAAKLAQAQEVVLRPESKEQLVKLAAVACWKTISETPREWVAEEITRLGFDLDAAKVSNYYAMAALEGLQALDIVRLAAACACRVDAKEESYIGHRLPRVNYMLGIPGDRWETQVPAAAGAEIEDDDGGEEE